MESHFLKYYVEKARITIISNSENICKLLAKNNKKIRQTHKMGLQFYRIIKGSEKNYIIKEMINFLYFSSFSSELVFISKL